MAGRRWRDAWRTACAVPILFGLALVLGGAPPGDPLALRGRAIGGDPGARKLHAVFFFRGGAYDGMRHASATLGPDGRFELTTLPPPDEATERALILRTDGPGEAQRWARLEWTAREPRSEVELGTVELVPAPILVTGRVLDERGEPLAGARVRVDVGCPANGAEPPRVHWHHRTDLAAFAGAEGRFELRGFLRTGEDELRLRVDHPALARAEPETVRAGARDVRLGGPPAHDARLRLLFDPAIRPHELRVRVRAVEESAAGLHCTPKADGAVHVRRLRPGAYVLTVHAGHEDEELARTELRTGTGEVDLGNLDVRGLVRVRELRFVDERGEPIPHAVVRRRPADPSQRSRVGGEPWLGEVRDGALRLVTGLDSLDLRIEARGRRRVDALAVEGDRTIVLPPPYEVTADLAQRPAWIPTGAEPRIALSGRESAHGLTAAGTCEADGVARIPVVAPGPYQVSLALVEPGTGRTLAWGGARVEWRVLDQEAPQHFTLEIDPDLEARLRSRLQR